MIVLPAAGEIPTSPIIVLAAMEVNLDSASKVKAPASARSIGSRGVALFLMVVRAGGAVLFKLREITGMSKCR